MTSTISATIKRVQAFARAKRWTKSRLAIECGIQTSTLRDFFEDDWNPTRETIARIERIIPKNFEAGQKKKCSPKSKRSS